MYSVVDKIEQAAFKDQELGILRQDYSSLWAIFRLKVSN